MMKKINARIDKKHFRVAIFGSARIKKNDWEYKLVSKLGSMLAEENISIVTGGGPGLMNAASEGHHKGRKGNGVHSVGLTIQLPHESKEQRSFHLDIHKDFKKFSGRLDTFMKYSNVVVVAPGGIGTMLEFFYTWQLVQVKHICETPIILLGSMWNGLIDWIRKDPLKKKLLDKEDVDQLYEVDDCEKAMEIIRKAKEIHDKGKNVCKNLDKYH
jgi:uncharacterized protein (TIGR00730 family)